MGNHAYGQQLYQEALVVVRDFAPNSNPYEFIIAGLGSTARSLGNPERAVRLFGAIGKIFLVNYANEHPMDARFRQDVAALRDQLGEASFSRLWAEGETMTKEQTIAYGLQTEPVSQPMQQALPMHHNQSQPSSDALTERELEILRAVAAGYSNRKIAAELFLALGTVKWYLNTINGKLGVSSRTQAVARARELGLIL
jgi:ATP/maltotriose-dependent transcriptional regulator MalT